MMPWVETRPIWLTASEAERAAGEGKRSMQDNPKPPLETTTNKDK